jgi:UDP-sulfoquinovose synthase
MKILILGGDGYLGWPTAMYLSKQGYEVAVLDNMIKHFWEAEVGVEPLAQTRPLHVRTRRWKELTGNDIKVFVCDIAENPKCLYNAIDEFKPNAVVHFAEQPSAPFSMIDRDKCISTQQNNVNGTLNLIFAIQHTNPDIHIIKLGTMGEYGTPNIDIEEGWLDVEHNGRKDRVLYPKKPHSFYHLSKVHDSNNLEFVCRVWGLRVTDLNQGAVYGVDTNETKMHSDLLTSFHYDSIFGTVINRFIVQSAKQIPMTVYGSGGQKRGFLNIIDTIRCIELAIENAADKGEFRVFNQFTEQFSLNELANKVYEVSKSIGLSPGIEHISNPRVEMEDHYYNARNSRLPDLGLQPVLLTNNIIEEMLKTVIHSIDRVDEDLIYPEIKWHNKK